MTHRKYRLYIETEPWGPSRDRLIFNMEIPITGKDGLYIKTGPGGAV